MEQDGLQIEDQYLLAIQRDTIMEQQQRILMLEAGVRQLMTQLAEAQDETVVPIEAAE